MTIGLLEYLMFEKMDCDMEPLLSITNKMMGGVIFDFTIYFNFYDSFQ